MEDRAARSELPEPELRGVETIDEHREILLVVIHRHDPDRDTLSTDDERWIDGSAPAIELRGDVADSNRPVRRHLDRGRCGPKRAGRQDDVGPAADRN